MGATTLYGVRNKHGYWFHLKSLDNGETWVNRIVDARLYSDLPSAKRCRTFFSSHFPKLEPPEIVELTLSEVGVVSEEPNDGKD